MPTIETSTATNIDNYGIWLRSEYSTFNDFVTAFKTTSSSGIDPASAALINDADLDLSSLLTGYNPLTDAITDFLQMTDNAGNTSVAIDRDGLGGVYSFQQVASLQGITGLTDEATLVTNGNVIV